MQKKQKFTNHSQDKAHTVIAVSTPASDPESHSLSQRMTECEDTALRLLGRREYSSFALQKKLKDRGFSREEIEPTLQRLKSSGALSDERFTAMYSRHLGRSHKSARDIAYRLAKSHRIKTTTSQLTHTEDVRTELEKVEHLLFVRMKRIQPDLWPDHREKTIQSLVRRGFPAEMVRNCWNKLIKEPT